MIVVRKATEKDCDFLSSLFYNAKFAGLFPEGNMTPARWRDRFPEIEHMHNYILLDTLRRNSSGIGWLLYHLEGETCHLHRIVIRQDLVGTGLGYYSFDVFNKQLPDTCKKIRLTVHPRNEHAIAFFTRYGFKTVGEEMQTVHGEDIPHIVMEITR